jgi:undecaprenyl diphosphate synthase
MPKHIALIIDGNGRWAKRRGLPRSVGHKFGFENLKKHIEYVQELGIKALSVYCFSKQNWNRPEAEVKYLMDTFNQMLDEYKKEYLNKDVRIVISGDMEDERISLEVRNKAKELMALTNEKTGFTLNCCINYGGREEILNVVNQIINNQEKVIDEKCFEKYLYTARMLPLDFIIRTSGEKRTSNFLPWQSTYSEWYFPKVLWPSFSKNDLIKALKVFMKRNRRFGAIKG